MKTFIILFTGFLFFIACQKSVPDTSNRTNNTQDSVTNHTQDSTNNTQDSITHNVQDSILRTGDTITYEVLTTDPKGWFGLWGMADGTVDCNVLDSVTYGSPVYFASGWRHTVIAPTHPFQALLSVASFSYSGDITANLYKNGRLVRSVKNDAMNGVAKLLENVQTDTLIGTATDPVLTYEVLVTEPDVAKFESDAWLGQWVAPNGVYNTVNKPLLQFLFAMPSGWKYIFKPEQLPFTMSMQATPYTTGGGKVTINFYVNGQLVKTSSSRDWIRDMKYVVQ